MSRLTRLLRLRPGEGVPVGLAVAASFFAFAGLMVGQSGIEALFFARYGVDALPTLYLILGGTMFLATLGIGVLLGGLGRGRACIAIPLVLALIATAGRLGLAGGATWIYPALWLLQGVAQFVLGLAVWGLAGIVTDTRQAKRFFPLIGAGGVLGQVVGGLVTKPLAAWIGTPNLIVVWVATLAAVAVIGARLIAGRRDAVRAGGDPEAHPIEQLRRGFQHVRRSALMRWMAAGSVLFSLLFFSLYLPFSRAATVRYPEPDDLAGFFGVFFGLSTGLAFVMSLFVTNRLLARFGVPTAMLVLPLLYVLAFGVLAIEASFAALLVFRFAQVAWMQGGAVSSWEAAINTVPPDRRDQTRAFLYGGPTQVGTVLAGVIALVGERALSPTVLYLVGLTCAVLATATMIGARRAYPRELVLALREGRPKVFDAAPTGAEPFGLARSEASAVAVVATALADPDPRVRRVAAHVLGDLQVSDETTAPLARALLDDDPDVRATAIRSLARVGASGAGPAVLERLADPDAVVRLAALDAVASLDGRDVAAPDVAAQAIRPLLRDIDPPVRARAAAALLRLASDAGEPDVEAEATIVELTRAGTDEVRAAAFREARGLHAPRLFDAARSAMQDPGAIVRAEAARAIATIDPERAIDVLVTALADDQGIVRDAAAEGLGTVGPAAVDPVLRSLASSERREGALAALERLPLDGRAKELRRFAKEVVTDAVTRHRLGTSIDHAGDERLRLLKDSLLARSERDAVAGLRATALIGGGGGGEMTVALENLSVSDPAQRANALEVIESVAERDLVRPLLSMWDAAPSRAATGAAIVDQLIDDPDDWIRACAKLATTPDGADPNEAENEAQNEGEPMTQTLATLSLMERILFLRKVPLFGELPPPDLVPIASIAQEHAFADGDTIAEQGDPGDAMHIIVSGEVSVIVADGAGEREVAVRSTGDVVGEMAIVSNRPRMAGLVARGPVRVLTIARRPFESILRERPETSLGVIRVLCQRLAEPGA